MKAEYKEGDEARKNFEEAMKDLFKAQKVKTPKGRKVEKQQRDASSQPEHDDKD